MCSMLVVTQKIVFEMLTCMLDRPTIKTSQMAAIHSRIVVFMAISE